MNHPEAYINFEVYENAVNFCGISKVTLPDINFLTQTINGAGIAGNVESVLTGMVDAMTTTFDFRSPTSAAAKLVAPVKHQIDLRVAEQSYDTVAAEKGIIADKYIMVVFPKSAKGGAVAPATASDASGEYSVYRYEAYKDGEELWCIDPYNNVCRIGGTDYAAPIRRALGK